MDLNQLIYERLATDESIASLLARFSGTPAIFTGEFPTDTKDGWNGKPQYPRIWYQVNMQVDAQRSSSGLLRTQIFAEKDMLLAERIESLVRNRLKDVLMQPGNSDPFAVAWARTDPYVLEGNAVMCKDLTFDVIEYPRQLSTDPDPVETLTEFIKGCFPDMFVVHLDRVHTFQEATADRPVVYVRLRSIETTGETNTYVGVSTLLSVHVICPDAGRRLQYASAIALAIEIESELRMTDRSPMKVNSVRLDNRADYLREGQISVMGSYGVLEMRPVLPKVRTMLVQDTWTNETIAAAEAEEAGKNSGIEADRPGVTPWNTSVDADDDSSSDGTDQKGGSAGEDTGGGSKGSGGSAGTDTGNTGSGSTSEGGGTGSGTSSGSDSGSGSSSSGGASDAGSNTGSGTSTGTDSKKDESPTHMRLLDYHFHESTRKKGGWIT